MLVRPLAAIPADAASKRRPHFTTGIAPYFLIMNSAKKLGANMATTCQRITSPARASEKPQPIIASGVGAIRKTIVPCDTAPITTASKTGGWRNIENAASPVCRNTPAGAV